MGGKVAFVLNKSPTGRWKHEFITCPRNVVDWELMTNKLIDILETGMPCFTDLNMLTRQLQYSRNLHPKIALKLTIELIQHSIS